MNLLKLGLCHALAIVLLASAGYTDGMAPNDGVEGSVMPSIRGTTSRTSLKPGVGNTGSQEGSDSGSSAPALSSSATLERATGSKLAKAIAHYARSRSLIAAAIREFDSARALARPDALIDSDAWRQTLLDRAEDLEKVLDPQPRASKGGVRFNADTRLLNEASRSK